MRYFIPIIILIISGCAFNQQTQIRKDNKQTFIELEEFGFRTKPILNREYIIFLCWYVAVYGESYPDKVLEILPLNTSYKPRMNLRETEDIFTHVDVNPIFKNYILNPKYIDYPLIGLSKHQVLELQKWMTDRYNENLLIDTKYLDFNPFQKDEDCYVLEAALAGQYMGLIAENWNDKYELMSTSDRWQEYAYKSNFRLPYNEELVSMKRRSDISNDLQEYSFGKEDFLWDWHKDFFETSKMKIKWREQLFAGFFGENFHYPFPDNLDFQLPRTSMKAIILEESEPQFVNSEYMQKDYISPKDSLGRMSFVVVGADQENRPIVADRIQASKQPLYNGIYRIVYNKTIDPFVNE